MTSPTFQQNSIKNLSFSDYIKSRVLISNELKTTIDSVCKAEKLSKNKLLLKEGLIANRLYIIQKGSARTFYLHDGKDVTSWIYPEGILITSWTSFFAKTPSFENVELLEDSTVVSISREDLHKLYVTYPNMQEFGRIMVEEQLVFLDRFFQGFNFMTAKQKYDLLLSIFPDVTQRVNLGHVASFLGITQETLSRIRRKSR